MFHSVFMIPIVSMICVFTFVTVAAWADSRRREREAFYRHETYQKILEGPSGSADAVQELIREEESRREQRRVAGLQLGLKLGGLITSVAGIGVGIFLYFLDPGEPVWVVGVIPLLVGLVLAAYGFHLTSRRREGG